MHKVDARDAPEIRAGRNSCGENKSMIADAARKRKEKIAFMVYCMPTENAIFF